MAKLDYCMKITDECLRKAKIVDPKGEELLKFAKDYYKDAVYFSLKDKETALEAVAYAHGFIDAAVLLGLVEIKDYHLSKQSKKL